MNWVTYCWIGPIWEVQYVCVKDFRSRYTSGVPQVFSSWNSSISHLSKKKTHILQKPVNFCFSLTIWNFLPQLKVRTTVLTSNKNWTIFLMTTWLVDYLGVVFDYKSLFDHFNSVVKFLNRMLRFIMRECHLSSNHRACISFYYASIRSSFSDS